MGSLTVPRPHVSWIAPFHSPFGLPPKASSVAWRRCHYIVLGALMFESALIAIGELHADLPRGSTVLRKSGGYAADILLPRLIELWPKELPALRVLVSLSSG